MSSDSTQLKLGQKKKVKSPPITERTKIDTNTFVLPDDLDLIKEAIDLSEHYRVEGSNTFYLKQHNKQMDFAYTDNTLLCLNYPCPGCGRPHTASIDLETAETRQLCTKSHAIFINVKEKKSIQVQMICPEKISPKKECGKHHNIMDYPVWKTISDKRCSDCQQKTIAEKEDKRKKSKKLSKEEESTAPQIPETTIEEVAEAIEELVPEETEDLQGSLHL